jgi:transcription elongation factor Elf1
MNTTTSYPQADARRRLRRRSMQGFDRRLFCGTNGCATRLDVDSAAGTARCHICGYTRRIQSVAQ